MKQLNLKFTGMLPDDTTVHMDGKQINFKKNKFGNQVATYQTEYETVKLEVYRLLDCGGVIWFLTQLFFFVISIFGIFDIHAKKRYLGLIYEADIELKEENDIILRCYTPKDGSKAFEAETDLVVREESNGYFVDKKAKKIFIFLLISKIFLAIAIIGVITAVLISKLY